MTFLATPEQRNNDALRQILRAIEQVALQPTEHMVTWTHGYATGVINTFVANVMIEMAQATAARAELELTREVTLQYLAEHPAH